MGFWNKLGKIALRAAPYVAAPFTAGASLAFVPAANQVGNMWAQHDANEAAKKGLGPSSFDKYLGAASGLADVASGLGAFGKFGSAAYSGGNAKPVSGWQANLGKAGNAIGGVSGVLGGLASMNSANPNNRGEEPTSAGLGPSAGMAQPRQSNLRDIFSRGRNEAVVNQPFRRGYETQAQGPDDTVITQKIPPMYPNYGPPPSDSGDAPSSIFNQAPTPQSTGTPIANRFADELTPPRRARKRNPEPEAVEEY